MRVSVLSLGGTIAMTPSSDGGVAPALDADDLVAAVPELGDLDVTVTARSLRSVPSASLRFADLVALHAAVEAELADGATGVVVTQGTDTLEETVFFLDRTVTSSAPVVVTGAMRHPSAAGSDGPANLLAAVRLAAAEAARDLGALVAFADEVHAAVTVRKAHTTAPAAFESPGFGPLGLLVEGEPRLLATPAPRLRLPVGERLTEMRIGVVPIALGDGGELLEAAGARFDGLVIAGAGGGHVPEWLAQPLGELAGRIPVVLASRLGAGPTLTATYGYRGSERDLLARGLVPAGFLDPYKARILLALLCAQDASPERIREVFRAFA